MNKKNDNKERKYLSLLAILFTLSSPVFAKDDSLIIGVPDFVIRLNEDSKDHTFQPEMPDILNEKRADGTLLIFIDPGMKTEYSNQSSPLSTLISYYNAVNRRDYSSANNCLSSPYESEEQYQKWTDGYRNTKKVELFINYNESKIEGAAGSIFITIPTVLISYDGKRNRVEYEGSYTLNTSNQSKRKIWKIHSGKFRRFASLLIEESIKENAEREITYFEKGYAFMRKILFPFHSEKKDPEFHEIYKKLQKEIRNKNKDYLFSLYDENIKCNFDSGENKETCIKDFNQEESFHNKKSKNDSNWIILNELLKLGAGKVSENKFIFSFEPPIGEMNRDYYLNQFRWVSGENVNLRLYPDRDVIEKISYEFVKFLEYDKKIPDWEKVQTYDNKTGYINVKYLQSFESGKKRLIFSKINGKWKITAFIGGI